MRRCRAEGCGRPAFWSVRLKVWTEGRIQRDLCRTHFNLYAAEERDGLRVLTARRTEVAAGR